MEIDRELNGDNYYLLFSQKKKTLHWDALSLYNSH